VSPTGCSLLPNLGAEEGDDWLAYRREPSARTAARLWSALFSDTTRMRSPRVAVPRQASDWGDEPVAELWPESLGPPASEPAYPWLESAGVTTPWLWTASIAAQLEREGSLDPSAPDPAIVARVHDKAFAVEAARRLDLWPAALSNLISVLEPRDLDDPDPLLEALAGQLAAWPSWTRGRFTLKPRSGSSGRGRVAGKGRVDTPEIRGALSRLAARGGAIFEPWLDRCADLSVCLYIPEAQRRGESQGEVALPTLLGSLEMLASPSGVYRGHCGELDSRGRIFSGHRDDESLRADCAAIANLAREAGYSGPCGVDAFVYREGDRERMRAAVEFNARPTMGLVTLGLLRRALPGVREALELTPGDRRAFLFVLVPPDAADSPARIAAETDAEMLPLGPRTGSESGAPLPCLFFTRELAPLRDAVRRELRC
jgi:hypothetical protein